METLANRIYMRRCELRLTQEELSDKAELSRSVIVGIEKGEEKSLRKETLSKLSKALDIDFDEIEKLAGQNTEDKQTAKLLTRKLVPKISKYPMAIQEQVIALLEIDADKYLGVLSTGKNVSI